MPLNNARCLQYISCIVLHYMVHSAFVGHESELRESLARKKQDDNLVTPFCRNNPKGYDADEEERVSEPGKGGFFQMMGLDVLTKGLLILGYTETKIRSSFRQLDTGRENLQNQVIRLSTNLAMTQKVVESMQDRLQVAIKGEPNGMCHFRLLLF